MSDTKPFIFIEPLSDTLVKLKEVISETASDEGIEIFMIEDLLEANQLIPTIGQSLIVCSNPKKCAAILQHNKKILSEFSSKVILLTPKVIPKKTLEKFMKVGLTECIVEPVPAKTLLYKVKLLLRSISTKKDQEELAMKSLKGDESESGQQMEKAVTSKGNVGEEEIENYLAKKEKQAEVEIDYESEIKTKKKADEENSHWEGEIKKPRREESLGHLEGENEGADHIETHYKGNLQSKSEVEEDERTEKKKDISLDLYDGETSEKKEAADIEIDMGDLKDILKKRSEGHQPKGHNSGESSTDKISTHYKGQIKNPVIDEEEYGDLIGSNDFDLDFDIPDNNREKAVEDEEEKEQKRSSVKLDFAEESKAREKDDPEEETEEDFSDRAKKVDLKFVDESEGLYKKKEKAEQAEKDPHEGQIDHIETMLKGHLDHTKPEEHGNEVSKLKRSEFAEEEKGPRDSEPEIHHQEEDEDLFKKKEVDLRLVTDDESENAPQEQSSQTDTAKERDHSPTPTEELPNESSAETNPDEEEQFVAPPKVDLKLEDAESNRKKAAALGSEDDLLRSKKIDPNAKEASKAAMSASGHVEHIQKYYKSGESINHQDDNWGNGLPKPAAAVQDEFKKSEEKTLSLLEKPDRGEQTIDYRKLKDQFDALTMGSDGKLKMQDILFTDSSANKKRKGPRYYRDDEDQKSEGMDEEAQSVEQEEKDKIYTCKLNGLDFVLTMLNIYEDKEKKEADFFLQVDKHLQNKFQAHSSFYCKKPGSSSFTPIHQSNFTHEEFDFETIASSKFETWNLMSLPFWYDHTFQTSSNQMFLFPYCEGTQKIGFAVIHFFGPLSEEQSYEVEIVLESLRGIYLQIFHQTGLAENYEGAATKPKEESGFMKKLMFWRKAS